MSNTTNTTGEGLEQLLALEEKINETIDLLRTTRAEKGELAEENLRLRHEWERQNETIQKLEDHLERFEKERDAVRGRIQRLLEQVDSLTKEKAG